MAKRKEPEQPEDRDEGDEDEGPWNEERWEAFMRESDLRSARFGEIFETVMDDPNRDRILAREMGWDWLNEALDEEEAARAAGELNDEDEKDEEGEGQGVPFADDPDEDEDEEPEGAKAEGGEGEASDPFDDEDDCDIIPAYRLANEVGMKVHNALKPYMSEKVKEEDYDERLGQAYIGCHIAAAKISGGHAMGYEDDVLCGNIVNCKRGLAGAQEAEEALIALRDEGVLPAALVDELLPDVRAVIEAVKGRIEELRKRVWW
jgi:hypothetical protein